MPPLHQATPLRPQRTRRRLTFRDVNEGMPPACLCTYEPPAFGREVPTCVFITDALGQAERRRQGGQTLALRLESLVEV